MPPAGQAGLSGPLRLLHPVRGPGPRARTRWAIPRLASAPPNAVLIDDVLRGLPRQLAAHPRRAVGAPGGGELSLGEHFLAVLPPRVGYGQTRFLWTSGIDIHLLTTLWDSALTGVCTEVRQAQTLRAHREFFPPGTGSHGHDCCLETRRQHSGKRPYPRAGQQPGGRRSVFNPAPGARRIAAGADGTPSRDHTSQPRPAHPKAGRSGTRHRSGSRRTGRPPMRCIACHCGTSRCLPIPSASSPAATSAKICWPPPLCR